MQKQLIGWDIGGAHLKAALINQQGKVNKIIQVPCPLWQGLSELQTAVQEVQQHFQVETGSHVLTMTGELADLFTSRKEGVDKIVQHMQQQLSGQNILLYAGIKGFLSPEKLTTAHYDYIASANWMASVSYAAQYIQSGLFVDIGSTTCDILCIDNFRVQTDSYSDFQRLCTEELIYTGIVRTPVCAVAHHTFFQGRQVGLMAEYFATMADVYRLTGELNEVHDQMPTADGADKTVAASARRLARMIACDVTAYSSKIWRQFADTIKTQQLQKIQACCQRQLTRTFTNQPVIIGAGVGQFLVRQIAKQLDCKYIDFTSLFDQPLTNSEMLVADCAPAVAVAKLAIEQL